MSSVREVAELAGVSITTVSRVLNNHPRVSAAAREKVVDAMNRKRYTSAVGRRSTTNIAYVYTGEFSLGSPFDAALLEGISRGIQQAELDLLILRAPRQLADHETYTQLFQQRGVRGAIIRSTDQTRYIGQRIADEGFPAVIVADELPSPRASFVRSDATAATRAAIEHLITLGHQRIAITLNVIDDHDHRERLAAYRQALTAAELPAGDDLTLRVPAYRDAGAAALRQIMSMPNRPTAVFVTDPHAAVGLMHEAQRQNVAIPDQLSVIGFDDTDVRLGVYPKMSAVCQEAETLGREAYAILDHLLRHPAAKPQRKTVACWLELHESTGRPNDE